MSYVNKSRRTFPAAEAIDSYRLVTLVAGEAALCDAAESPLGVTEYAVADGDLTSVRLLNTEGTIEVMATGVVAIGGDVQTDAAGTVKADAGAGARTIIGKSLTAVADGGVIEVIPYGYGNTFAA
uniref:DUF2190 family protein n=1 Tax=Desulfovibrio sp. U5L TaxID=596152 RepID=I2Q2P5_9BACT